jgi:hypothetical protein
MSIKTLFASMPLNEQVAFLAEAVGSLAVGSKKKRAEPAEPRPATQWNLFVQRVSAALKDKEVKGNLMKYCSWLKVRFGLDTKDAASMASIADQQITDMWETFKVDSVSISASEAEEEGAAAAVGTTLFATEAEHAAVATANIFASKMATAAAVAAAEPGALDDQVFKFLFELQDAGTVNMIASGANIQTKFGVTRHKADIYVMRYIQEYDELAKRFKPSAAAAPAAAPKAKKEKKPKKGKNKGVYNAEENILTFEGVRYDCILGSCWREDNGEYAGLYIDEENRIDSTVPEPTGSVYD